MRYFFELLDSAGTHSNMKVVQDERPCKDNQTFKTKDEDIEQAKSTESCIGGHRLHIGYNPRPQDL